MKVTTNTVFDILSNLRAYFQGESPSAKYDDGPFRSELYSSGQLEEHAKIVAKSHKLLKYKPSDQLLNRLEDNQETLLEVRNLLVESIKAGKAISPGAEWLVDNFYLIEEQVVIAKKHLPKGYSEGLPCLSQGASAGMPRVYDIVLEIISHSDGRVDVKSLSSFIKSYQSVTILTLGELWAIPIMVRLAVIENLRRVSGKIALDMIDHNLADYWASLMLKTVEENPGDLILAIADMARSQPVLDSAFVAGFSRELQGKGPALALPLNWMEQQLAGQGVSSNDLVRHENQKQAADQVSVRNCIGTLRFIGATDWREFVETLSSVEQVLRRDISGTYAQMDFATRDRYRHVVESISKKSRLSETEVAEKALELARRYKEEHPESIRHAHVGFYLIDRGLKQTERASKARFGLLQNLSRGIKKAPLFFYLFFIVLLALAVAGGMWYLAYTNGVRNWWMLGLLGVLSVSGASQLAISLVNWLSTICVTPSLLPRMDFSKGIPVECRTIVVVPTMLASKEYIEELVEGLEIRFLANREANLHFALLTDFLDAKTEHLPNDAELVEFARQAIEGLNQRYKLHADEDIFFLFHRDRKWNPREKMWMGYERKRGKLAALNALLLRKENSFSVVYGDCRILANVKYVITLDSDTELPREAAWKFIATMAHPLNRAIYDPVKKRVTEGYGILQPRVASSIPKTATSLYLRLQGDVTGIDPYTRVSSDVYQDLFAEGSFIGKGIYDVAIFEQALHGVFPENRILSHDLLEGCYTRSGLLSDVLLYEENPTQYKADVQRHHRWIRGDWQIGSWILPFVRNGAGKLVSNKLSVLSKWKIFDNLRRSVLPLSLVLLLLLGWTVFPFPWFWTLIVTIIILLPVMAAAGWQLLNKPREITFSAHLAEVGLSVRDALFRFMFSIAVLPYEAYKYTDAVIRTNWRMLISGKKLLEWKPSAASSRNPKNDVWAAYKSMWIAPFAALACIVFLFITNKEALLIASPMLLLWISAPAITWRFSLPEREKLPELPQEQVDFLHKTARKTWAFFEHFVNAEENFMPPDNFQEQPVSVIAHRTSPTNMGLALLSNLSAYDFGYTTGGEMLTRCSQTINSMLKLERYRGHFYNWYDTLSLLPLQPRYVSAVDSGNLVGHLLTLRQGFLALPGQPILSDVIFKGLRTTLLILQEFPKGNHSQVLDKMMLLVDKEPEKDTSLLLNTKDRLDQLKVLAEELSQSEISNTDTLNHNWTTRLLTQLENSQTELIKLAPWVEILPVPEAFVGLEVLNNIPSLSVIQEMPDMLSEDIERYEQQVNNADERSWLISMRSFLSQASSVATERIAQCEHLAEVCEELSDVEYNFLLDKSTNLLSIGFNVDEQRRDDSYYDLLASEARLGIFAAIAQGKLPQESWFALGRLLTNSGGDPILLSWSGSMFEYLMPQIVMPSYENTLIYQTNKATVKRQIDYAAQRGVPWGISESGYNNVDTNLNYQYRAFGVPGLGLKRGLEEDLVIAPYASMMALMVSPLKAASNLQLLSDDGFEGEYGFYEAIDYTSSRLPRGKTHVVVQSYMVHHQGMGLLSMAYLLLNRPMQQRFLSELRFQATLLLLQERIPRTTLFYAHTADIYESHTETANIQVRSIPTADTVMPEIQLLSNGAYQLMVTNSGGGYSRWRDLAVTRWREDTTRDNHGIFCYIKDVTTGKFWSNTFQPTMHPVKDYKVVFSQGHVEFRRVDYGIDTKTEIVISPEDDTEMRRVRITNKTQSVRVFEVTSYAEVVLASQASDEAHPAFSNLFVQTEIMPQYNAILCTRRPRSENEVPPWMFHLMEVHGVAIESVSYETDRMEFIGRGNTVAHPQAMDRDMLSGKQGSVLDPILSTRYRITIKPGQTATVDLIYGVSETKETCVAVMNKYRDKHLKNRAFELSWTHSQVMLRQINATESDAQLYGRLAGSIIYNNPALRADATIIQNNYRGQSWLWSHSISGDLPIILLHVYDMESLELVRQMIQAHAYWRLKGLAVDLVIWNEDHGSYRQLLQEQIQGLVTLETDSGRVYSKPGNIYVKSADQLSTEDRILFESVARVIIHDNKETLAEQVNRRYVEKVLPPLLEPQAVADTSDGPEIALPADLVFFNGVGGFTTDGREYKILTKGNKTTPAPWVNVLANRKLGSIVSESGSAYSWAINAHEYRITPWSNDPAGDVGGEAFYLRDEETGHFWSPSPYPKKGKSPYIITHGFGYSTFEHREKGVLTNMSVFVDKELPVKFVVIKVTNQSGRKRKFSATGFLEIILGDNRSKTNMHIISEQDPNTGALLFRNRYNSAFSERVAYFKVSGGVDFSYTADRTEFIGRNRSLEEPQALFRKKLSGKTGAGIDACGALHVKFDLLDGAENVIIFQIGNEVNASEASALVRKFADKEAVLQSLADVKEYWDDILGSVQVTTPDTSLNILANGWLTYQTIASRMFAKSGFYQSGGAFGYRDQLQDVLALLHVKPEMAREQILLNASRQFTEGDVQHWWHPPEGRGVRTRCSDDMLWLPFVAARYTDVTGDTDILSANAGFLESRTLHEGEETLYDLPVSGNVSGSLYEHCVRAIKYSLRFGEHGLPLIGAGDWNDGMDQVGNKGRGESVWLGFFFYDILIRFAVLAGNRGDEAFAELCKKEATKLQANIEASSWDGEWYRRAYFDDGAPLGSAQNEECRIDAIAQSWSVLSGAAGVERRTTAMASLDKYLVRRDLKLIQLLDPPFDSKGPNPGYIRGYVPGVRENGGQYSHAAIWTLMAFAEIGQREKVYELFSMLQPPNHALDADSVQVYKVEPYVMAADVYANESHRGRGGWTWYTGSAGWMYQFIINSFLGLNLKNDKLVFNPCFPLEWPSVDITYRYGKSSYQIGIFQSTDTDSWWKLDGTTGKGNEIPLVDDGKVHLVEVHILVTP